jgi:hypothetical protein
VTTPEQQARQNIDRQLLQPGWLVQDRQQINISTRLGVAVREFPLTAESDDRILHRAAREMKSTGGTGLPHSILEGEGGCDGKT